MIDQFTRPKEFYIKRYNLNSLLNPLPMVATTRFQPYLHPEKSVLHSDMSDLSHSVIQWCRLMTGFLTL